MPDWDDITKDLGPLPPNPRDYDMRRAPGVQDILATGVPEAMFVNTLLVEMGVCDFCHEQTVVQPYQDIPLANASAWTCFPCVLKHRDQAQAECRHLQREHARLSALVDAIRSYADELDQMAEEEFKNVSYPVSASEHAYKLRALLDGEEKP